MRIILFTIPLLISSLVISSLVFLSSAFAQSNAVVVLPFGGVQTVPVRSLDSNNEVISLGDRRVVPVGEDVRISDIKILPDGSHLMADLSGRGFGVTDQDGNYRYEFSTPNTIPSIKTVSVGTYFSPGQPSILAIADSASQVALLRENSSQQVVWGQSVRQAESQANIVQIVVQPENLVSIAANYPSVGLSVIDTYLVSQQGQSPKRFSNIQLGGQPPNTIIVPGLDQIRELMVLEDGAYLITTRVNLILLSSDGLLVWSISIGDLPELGGEFSAARMLPSGLLAVTTYEPGEWTRPHFNHRVHWIDITTQTLVASSDVFSAAPIRVEPLMGHGGTGTFGFEAGLNEIGKGDFQNIALNRLVVDPLEIEVGDRLSYAITLLNSDTFSVALKEVKVNGFPGSCDSPGTLRRLGSASSVAIGPNATFTFNDDLLIDNTFELGEWCASVQIEDALGAMRTLDEINVEFSIVKRKTESSSTVEIDDLPFREGPVDFGNADADMGELSIDIVPDSGGCCATTSTKDVPMALLFVLVGFIFLRGKFVAKN